MPSCLQEVSKVASVDRLHATQWNLTDTNERGVMNSLSATLPRHMMLCAIISALALILIAPSAVAQFKPVPGREYREFYNPVNPVRGEAVVGLAVVPTEAAQRAGVIQVYLQGPYTGEILVEATTADGRFRGEGIYAGSTRGKEWISLPLTSSSQASGKDIPLRPTSPTLLSIAARGPGGSLLVVQWGDQPPFGSSDKLRLYVNSRRAEMFVRAGTNSGANVVRCMPINIQQSIRFDSYCDLAISELPKNGQVVLIRRDQFDEQTQTIQLHLP